MRQATTGAGRARWLAAGMAVALALPGCARLGIDNPLAGLRGGAPEAPAEAPEGDPGAPLSAAGAVAVPAPEARTVEDFDTTTPEQREAAAAPPAAPDAEEVLGTTVASLGDAGDPGFWAETPLVDAVRPGRLTDPATGKTVQVELRPSGGAPGSGSRVSLPALRALEVSLTALPELRVTGL